VAQNVINHRVQIGEPPISQFLFADTRMAWFWLVVRIYVGYQWLEAGYAKFTSPAWTGDKIGTGLGGFVAGALQKTTGAHADVPGWYASFLQSVVLPNVNIWSWAVTLGEMAIGLGLIFGVLTGIAAFFGGFMNANFLFSGTVSINPLLFVMATWLVLAWRIAGYVGVDHWLLPALGVPGEPGEVFVHGTAKTPSSRQATV
jgi:thiosulfate dehydrogenase [quinone] large subunit